MSDTQKHTKPNVPNLRFPGFSGEWKQHLLSEYLEFKNGLNPSAKSFGEGIKFISVMDILNNPYITYDCIRASVNATEKEKQEFNVEYGDILFQRSSETLEDVGHANVYLDKKPALFGGFTIRGKKKGDYNPLFFKYLLDSPKARKKVIVKGAGAQHFNIGQEGLSSVSLYFPSMHEQNNIAELLELIDQRIAIQNKVIEKYESLIKAITDKVVERLLKGRLVAFRELYTEASEGGTPSTSEHKYYENGSIPFIKIDDLSSKYLTTNKDFITELGVQKSTAWIIPENSVIFSNGATIGAISINTYPVCTKQGILGIVPKPGVGTEYLYYLMSSSYFNKQIQRIVTEGTMKTAYLKDINHIKCPLPTTGIQEKMVSGLSSITSKIDLEKQIRNKLLSTKNYLLQSLFI